MSLKEDLTRVRRLIESGWTRGAWARTESGSPCWEDNTNAVCWCLSGAVQKVFSGDESTQTRIDLTRALVRNLPAGFWDIPAWNDEPGRTKEEVLALIDKTIEGLPGEVLHSEGSS